MDQSLKKGILTHGLAILGFFIVTVLLFYPQFFSGKELFQHDILQGKGGNHQMIEHREKTGDEALWMNSMFSGMPAYLNGVQYSGDLIAYVYKIITLGIGHPRGITFVSSLCFYILLLAFKVRPWIAFIGALSFTLNGFNIISITAGHNAKIAAVALMPLILAGIHLAFTGKKWLGLGLTALGLALQLRTGHYQITYYLILIASIYGVFRLIQAIRQKELKPFMTIAAGLILAGILALGTSAGKLWTVYEYSKVSIRGKSELKPSDNQSSGLDRDYAFEFSNGIFEPLVMFIPNILGGASAQELSKSSATADALSKAGYGPAQVKEQIKSMPTYWGDQRLSAPYYAGSIVVLLFIVGLFILKKEEKLWLVVVATLGIVLSWGSNFSIINNFLFDYLPMYNKFRSVTFIIVMPILALNLLAFQALERIFQMEWDKVTMMKLLKAVAIPAGFAFLLILGAGMLNYRGSIDERLPDWLISAIREDRASLLRRDALRALFFIITFSAIIWAYFKKKISTTVVVAGLILITFLDTFLLSKRFLKEESFSKSPASNYFKPTSADTYVMNLAQSGDRVLNLQGPFNEARTSYYHESLGGYHGAKIRRYQDLIENSISPEMNTMIEKLQKGRRDFSGMPAINMLNARFIMAGNTKEAVLENPNALGNAWIVSGIIAVDSPDKELESVRSFNPLLSAIIDQSKFDLPKISSTAIGTVEVLKRSPNEIIYKADVTGDALAVFSEIYYDKGWKASVDGQETKILRANYVLRALPLSAGSHEIKFSFEPKSYQTGNTIMWICSVLVLILFGSGLVVELKKGLG
ncbi:MAG: hypothetical protein ACJA08_001649 [Cyclobacteriaceae bacterium]|jgi:hypothetical protein